MITTLPPTKMTITNVIAAAAATIVTTTVIATAIETEIPTATSLLITDIGLNVLTNYNINWAVDKYFVFCVQRRRHFSRGLAAMLEKTWTHWMPRNRITKRRRRTTLKRERRIRRRRRRRKRKIRRKMKIRRKRKIRRKITLTRTKWRRFWTTWTKRK